MAFDSVFVLEERQVVDVDCSTLLNIILMLYVFVENPPKSHILFKNMACPPMIKTAPLILLTSKRGR